MSHKIFDYIFTIDTVYFVADAAAMIPSKQERQMSNVKTSSTFSQEPRRGWNRLRWRSDSEEDSWEIQDALLNISNPIEIWMKTS